MDLGARQRQSSQILQKYPGRFPIIVRPAPSATTLPISRNLFIVYGAQNFYGLIRHIRPYIDDLDDVQTLFFFINDAIIPSYHTHIDSIYERYKQPDGFLYITYIAENSFG